ncbi:MAG: pyridoxal-phosphate-dependent aminotransferase family protein [Anaerolineae bacterium]
MKSYKLMIPGPVDPTDEVLAQMALPVSPHYGPEWAELYEETIGYLKQVFQTENDLYLIVGPGSAALDAALGSLLAPGEKVLILANGFFGHRLAEISKACGLTASVLSFPLGQPISPEELASRLGEEEGIKAVAVVHHETSTGVLNPLQDIARVVHEHDLPIIVDAVSSIGGTPLPVDDWSIDLCISVANKCLEAPPGVAPISVSPRAWQLIDARSNHLRWYLNLQTWREYADKWAGFHPYPTTLPTNNVLALRASLQIILQEGLEARYERYAQAAGRVRRGLEELGFEMFVEEKYASPLTTSVKGRPGASVKEIIGFLKEEHGILISGGIEELADRIFRVGHMGKAASPEYIVAFLAGVEDFLERKGLKS